MPRKKQRTEAMRQEILRSALDLLDEGGVAAVTARGVAKSANTSVPAVYELFGDKEGLVRALFFEGFRALRDTFDAVGFSGGGPSKDSRYRRDRRVVRQNTTWNTVATSTMIAKTIGRTTRSTFVVAGENFASVRSR